MRWIASAVLYMATALGANAEPATLSGPEIAALEALREGQMTKLRFHELPRAASDLAFLKADNTESDLASYAGKVLVLNFWATWCAPCLKEMPGLDRLNLALGGDDFAVVTLATGRNSPVGIARFFDKVELQTLTQYRDIKQGIAREMEIPGLPTTVILDREGREIARMTGEAEWDTPSAKAIVAALIEGVEGGS